MRGNMGKQNVKSAKLMKVLQDIVRNLYKEQAEEIIKIAFEINQNL